MVTLERTDAVLKAKGGETKYSDFSFVHSMHFLD